MVQLHVCDENYRVCDGSNIGMEERREALERGQVLTCLSST